jgi:hypothetical protein
MVIVWGSNHYRLKKISPTDIGLLDPSFNGITFELRQRYGHLMWIPIFPLGKIWVVNKGDGNKYVCPTEIEDRLNAYGFRKSKLSVFAWSWFLIIGIVMLFLYIQGNIQEKKYAAYQEEQKVSSGQALKERVKELTTNDCLFFLNANSTQVPMQVLAVKGDSIRLGGWAHAGQTEPMDDYYERGDEQPYYEKPVSFSFWTSRALLLTGLDMQIASKNGKEVGIQLYNFNQKFWLCKIGAITPPKLAISESEGTTNYYCEIINKGRSVKADSIVAYTNNSSIARWELSKNRDLAHGNKIAVKTNVEGNALLYCSDADGRSYAFKLTNSGSWYIHEQDDADENQVYMHR